MAQLGSGEYTYEVSGENWGELPDGWVYQEATAVAVDSSDDVYVYNRGGHPVIVFDSDGKFLRSWGEDIFITPHGITIGPDDSVFCVDVGDCTVRKLTTDGKVLFTLGDPGNPCAADERQAVWATDARGCRPAQRQYLRCRRVRQRPRTQVRP